MLVEDFSRMNHAIWDLELHPLPLMPCQPRDNAKTSTFPDFMRKLRCLNLSNACQVNIFAFTNHQMESKTKIKLWLTPQDHDHEKGLASGIEPLLLSTA